MTILEAINEVDMLDPNQYTSAEKIKWLFRFDQQIKRDIYDTHEYNEGESEPVLGTYDSDHTGTTLLVPAPYDEIYIHYLFALIEYFNREIEQYNNRAEMLRSFYDSFRNDYNARHMPKSVKKMYY